VKNLMVDARTTHRWYFVIAMGRKFGHLALGIGKAVGATLTLIPEEFPQGKLPLSTIVDTLVGAIVKRVSDGRADGVAVLAEGLVERLDEVDLKELPTVERDAHGHIRIAEVNIGEILKLQVQAKLKKLKVKTTIVSKNIGYEVRCADPIPFDMEYARDLGCCAARCIIEGGSGVLVSMQEGRFRPIPMSELMDPQTGRMRLRAVDINSDRYKIAAAYMIRLDKKDFDDAHVLARHAAAANMSLEEFRSAFGYLVEGVSHQPLPRASPHSGGDR